MKEIKLKDGAISLQDCTDKHCNRCIFLRNATPVRCGEFGSVLAYDERLKDYRRSQSCLSN